jgi:hypothetical protein
MLDLLREVLLARGPQFLHLLDSPELTQLTEDQRDQLRELVADELCATGLSVDDEPNQRGVVLDDLIGLLRKL